MTHDRRVGDDAFTCSTVADPRSIVRATRPSVPMLQPSASSAFTICLISLFIGSSLLLDAGGA